jgi:hypothetical protein
MHYEVWQSAIVSFRHLEKHVFNYYELPRSLGVKLCDKGEELLFVEFHYKAAEDKQYSLARNSS